MNELLLSAIACWLFGYVTPRCCPGLNRGVVPLTTSGGITAGAVAGDERGLGNPPPPGLGVDAGVRAVESTTAVPDDASLLDTNIVKGGGLFFLPPSSFTTVTVGGVGEADDLESSSVAILSKALLMELATLLAPELALLLLVAPPTTPPPGLLPGVTLPAVDGLGAAMSQFWQAPLLLASSSNDAPRPPPPLSEPDEPFLLPPPPDVESLLSASLSPPVLLRVCRLCFMRLFWNQTFTWRSVRSREAAISMRRGRHRYLLKWNSFSSSRSWVFV